MNRMTGYVADQDHVSGTGVFSSPVRVACQGCGLCPPGLPVCLKMLTVHFHPPCPARSTSTIQVINGVINSQSCRCHASRSISPCYWNEFMQWQLLITACLWFWQMLSVSFDQVCFFVFFCAGWCEQFFFFLGGGDFCSPSAFKPVQTQRPV